MIDNRVIRIMNKSDAWLMVGFFTQTNKRTSSCLHKRFTVQTHQRLADRLSIRTYNELCACVNASISAQTDSGTIICITKGNYRCAFSLLVSQSIIQFISQSINKIYVLPAMQSVSQKIN